MFAERDYQGTHFSGLTGDGLVVEDVRFDGCVFEECSFQEATFGACVFDDCRFVGCNLALVSVADCRFSASSFENSKATGVPWCDADWSAKAVAEPFRFSGCVLDLSVFMGLGLDRVVFRDCSLVQVDFSGARLREADFGGSDLSGARFSRTDLGGARLEEARGYAIDITDNTVTGMRVSLPEAVSLLRSTGVDIVAPTEP